MIKVKDLKNRFWKQQDWDTQIDRIIGFTNIARITILFTLMMFSAIASDTKHLLKQLVDEDSPANRLPEVMVYLQSSGMKVWFAVYGFLLLLGVFYPSWQKQNRGEMPNITSVVDITMMVLLTHLLGSVGVGVGFGILILPFLAVSCVLSYGRYWLLYASYAALLLTISFLVQYVPFDRGWHAYVGVSANFILLVVGFYLVSVLTSLSASYLTSASQSVEKHRTAYEQISALNKVVLNRMREAVIVVDETRRVWLHNRRAIFYFPNLKVNTEAHFLQELVRRWRSNTRQFFETNIMINDVDMNIRATPVYQNDVELLILFIRSEKDRQAEAQSVKLTSLGLLTANLAHEIRNPLSAVRQANGLMTESAEDDPIMTKLCSIIDKNIARIDRMIEEVSTLNKSDRTNKETIKLDEFWKNFQQEFLLTRPEATGSLKVDISRRSEAVFDPMHLQQILWNLCNNAWRHCQKKAHSIHVAILPLINSDFVSITVRDDGGGVPDEMQIHLFEPFFTTQSQSEGTGLGLYVARELAHANRGDLRYLPNRKAFEILLPKARYD